MFAVVKFTDDNSIAVVSSHWLGKDSASDVTPGSDWLEFACKVLGLFGKLFGVYLISH